MDDFVKAALEIVKAQASVRTMTEEELVSMTRNLTASLKGLEVGEAVSEEEPVCAPGKSIKEKSISCCVCGKSFKILTKKHLASHGLDAVSYREKFGFKKNLPLVCKSLQRMRRKKMTEMKLWTKRKGAKPAKEAPKAAKPAKAAKAAAK
ncbi:MAG TPA: MucR family transcriptional regulator [Desulfovibrio sp.]|jgi:predicted transcriptional regulator|uniref:MucR family transcriptional regulator n=1 Tax=Desulfovibrio TaxID=872 RepID=UPI002A48885E|nr:MucR family transcriptional regulator [Desulfovibrio sp.]MDY0307759.1 MucR family transcriptional regulator [Desulfovibrionaceae bacterium]HMM38898.1 MucR family transcriptional regulator [Desulfovibrio sp.]